MFHKVSRSRRAEAEKSFAVQVSSVCQSQNRGKRGWDKTRGRGFCCLHTKSCRWRISLIEATNNFMNCYIGYYSTE
jgi:hypothetical protein